MTIPCDFSTFNIGAELERLNGSIPWRKPVSASSRAALKEYTREAVEREFAGQMREALEAVLNDDWVSSGSPVWVRVSRETFAKVRAVLDDIRAQTGEDFHDSPL